MDFDFIDNSPINEAERSEVVKRFVDFIDSTLADAPAEDSEMDYISTNTKKVETKKGDLRLIVEKQHFKHEPTSPDMPPFEDTKYKIDLNLSHFSDAGTTIHSETYTYSENNPSANYVERMTGNMAMDGTNTSHTAEKHEVGSTELAKIIQLVSDTLVEK